jgi:hypothetical protein
MRHSVAVIKIATAGAKMATEQRIDGPDAEGPGALNFSVEARCTSNAIRSSAQQVPLTFGFEVLTRWEETNARLLSEAGNGSGALSFGARSPGQSLGSMVRVLPDSIRRSAALRGDRASG